VEQIMKEGGAALLGSKLGVDPSKAQQVAQAKAGQVQEDARKRAEAEAAAQQKKLEDEAKNKLKGLFGK